MVLGDLKLFLEPSWRRLVWNLCIRGGEEGSLYGSWTAICMEEKSMDPTVWISRASASGGTSVNHVWSTPLACLVSSRWLETNTRAQTRNSYRDLKQSLPAELWTAWPRTLNLLSKSKLQLDILLPVSRVEAASPTWKAGSAQTRPPARGPVTPWAPSALHWVSPRVQERTVGSEAVSRSQTVCPAPEWGHRGPSQSGDNLGERRRGCGGRLLPSPSGTTVTPLTRATVFPVS